MKTRKFWTDSYDLFVTQSYEHLTPSLEMPIFFLGKNLDIASYGDVSTATGVKLWETNAFWFSSSHENEFPCFSYFFKMYMLV